MQISTGYLSWLVNKLFLVIVEGGSEGEDNIEEKDKISEILKPGPSISVHLESDTDRCDGSREKHYARYEGF